MEWTIDFLLMRRTSTAGTATFSYNGQTIGSIEVDPQTHGSPDMAFVELIKRPHRWSVLPPDLHRAMLVYRKETLSDEDYRTKTYRFLRVAESVDAKWKLTDDKSDLHVEKEQKRA